MRTIKVFTPTKHILIFDVEGWFLYQRSSWKPMMSRGRLYLQLKRQKRFHRELLRAKKGDYIDHINRNSLDNRRCNLRFCTAAQNQGNTCLNRNNKSGYKGVYQNKRNGSYIAQISKGKKGYYLGSFKTAEEAALTYDKEAKDYFGEFANLNFYNGVFSGIKKHL